MRDVSTSAAPRRIRAVLYSLDPPGDVDVALVADLVARDRVAVSADDGPSLLMGWCKPSLLVVYTHSDLDALGLVDARLRRRQLDRLRLHRRG